MVGGCQLHKNIKNQFKLKLGQVDFINCLPVNLPLELGKVEVNAEIINGLPSELNKMILNGEIDIAPVSSITYLENKDKLVPIADLCIASDGPADSVLLFSKYPLEELDGESIALSHASATSNKLLEIILKEFYGFNNRFNLHQGEWSKYSAALFIGDHALLEFSKKPTGLFVYDLGSLWNKHTNLPMTFGVWVIRKDVYENFLVETQRIASLLRNALKLGLGPIFDQVIKKAQSRILLPKEFYETYFKHLDYEFNNECKEGLKVFEQYCRKTQPTVV